MNLQDKDFFSPERNDYCQLFSHETLICLFQEDVVVSGVVRNIKKGKMRIFQNVGHAHGCRGDTLNEIFRNIFPQQSPCQSCYITFAIHSCDQRRFLASRHIASRFDVRFETQFHHRPLRRVLLKEIVNEWRNQ